MSPTDNHEPVPTTTPPTLTQISARTIRPTPTSFGPSLSSTLKLATDARSFCIPVGLLAPSRRCLDAERRRFRRVGSGCLWYWMLRSEWISRPTCRRERRKETDASDTKESQMMLELEIDERMVRLTGLDVFIAGHRPEVVCSPVEAQGGAVQNPHEVGPIPATARVPASVGAGADVLQDRSPEGRGRRISRPSKIVVRADTRLTCDITSEKYSLVAHFSQSPFRPNSSHQTARSSSGMAEHSQSASASAGPEWFVSERMSDRVHSSSIQRVRYSHSYSPSVILPCSLRVSHTRVGRAGVEGILRVFKRKRCGSSRITSQIEPGADRRGTSTDLGRLPS